MSEFHTDRQAQPETERAPIVDWSSDIVAGICFAFICVGLFVIAGVLS